MKTQQQITDELLKTEQEYDSLRKDGNLTSSKRIRLYNKIKTLKWVLEDIND